MKKGKEKELQEVDVIKTTVVMDRDVWKGLQHLAIEGERSFTWVLHDALTRYLKSKKGKESTSGA
ncbi:MAG: hypothetical protein AAB037_00450 [Chloroflexota bacterium]